MPQKSGFITEVNKNFAGIDYPLFTEVVTEVVTEVPIYRTQISSVIHFLLSRARRRLSLLTLPINRKIALFRLDAPQVFPISISQTNGPFV